MSTADEDIRSVARKLLQQQEDAMREADDKNPVLPSVIKDPLGAAKIVMERYFIKDGLPQIAYWRENWYSYYNELWSQRTSDDITHFIHHRLTDCRSVTKDGDTVDFATSGRSVSEIMYQIQNKTTIPSHYSVPVARVKEKWKEQDATGKIICRGQVVDMKTGVVKSNHGMFIPNGAEWKWDKDAGPPKKWLKFLKELFADKQGEIDLLQDWMGYVLSGDTWAQKGLILVGPKRAGKGTIGHVISRLLGKSMVASPSLHSLGKDFGLQPLLDKRLCLVSDARLSNRADIMSVIEVLLRITAGDSVDVGRKHRESVNSILGVRVMMLSNEMPQLSDSSDAINSRFLVLSLNNSFYGKEDTKLIDKLTDELPSIAHWATEGYRRLLKQGRFVEPESSKTARNEWYQENNPLSEFIEDRCVVEESKRIAATDLYEAYKAWADARGAYVLAANQLSRQMATQLGNRIKRAKSGSIRYFQGIDVLPGDF